MDNVRRDITYGMPLGRVLVAGLGKSGVAAVSYFLKHPDIFDSLTVVDSSSNPRLLSEIEKIAGFDKVNTLFGIDELDVDQTFDTCVMSPGFSPLSPMYRSIEEHTDKIISEIEFAYGQSEGDWVAITGTNGKTTTTALTTHMLKGAGIDAISVGNIGTPAIEAVETARKDSVFVAEVSSFQLHAIDTFKPRVCALLNITPDHINWHGTLENYADDKARVFKNCGQGDVVLLNSDDTETRKVVSPAERTGADVIGISFADEEIFTWAKPDELNIKGPHNISNALFAAHIARALGVDDAKIASALKSFLPVEHRLELVVTKGGVQWYNDSKATNPDAVFKALSAFESQPVILLVGGRNKGNRFLELARYAFAKPNIKEVICFGEAKNTLFDDFSSVERELVGFDESNVRTSVRATMTDAVKRAQERALPGDCVLLSPANASFDEFSSFEHRGREFVRLVGNESAKRLS